MNTTILQKCVAELKKESPNLQYVLGIMETLIDMSGTPKPTPYVATVDLSDKHYVKSDAQEEIPAAARPGPIGRIS